MQKLEKEVRLLLNLFKLRKLSEAELLNRKLIDENPKSIFLYNILGLILFDQKIDNQPLRTGVRRLKKKKKIKESKWKKFLRWIKNEK